MDRSFTQRFLDRAGMSGETLPGQPLIELWGDSRVLIENHQGVAMYGTEQIHIRVRFGQVCILGSQLRLCHMQRNQIVIAGRIAQIKLLGRCG